MPVIHPYAVPLEQQGWRGLSLPGSRKRKCYTVLQNEQVLVTMLVILPGDIGVRHSHEGGELSIRYQQGVPLFTWNPPGFVHGGVTPAAEPEQPEAVAGTGGQGLDQIARQLEQFGVRIEHLSEQLARLTQPEPQVVVDVLFPPFRTTIDDPAYPEKVVIEGQWFD